MSARAVGLGCALLFAGAAQAQDLRALEADIAGLEAEAKLFPESGSEEPARPDPTALAQRMASAERAFRLGNYVRATQLLTAIDGAQPQPGAVADVSFLLGEALFLAGDELGARGRFRQILGHAAEPTFRPFAGRALGRLIEIAARSRDFEGIDAAFDALSRLGSAELDAELVYHRAKYLYDKAVPVGQVTLEPALDLAPIDAAAVLEARRAFERVPESSSVYPQARYFIAVTLILERRLPEALDAFGLVAKLKTRRPEHVEVIELAQLALGRLHYEGERLDQALAAYQQIATSSPRFEAALYEIAWVYIRMGDASRAEHALELFALAMPDSARAGDGLLLRGNLLLANGQLADASRVFKTTADHYRPARREIDGLLAKHSDLLGYFRQVVAQTAESGALPMLVPSEAQAFVDESLALKQTRDALAELAGAASNVRQLEQLIERLEVALRAPSFELFAPDLRFARARAAAARNRAAQLRAEVVRLSLAKSGGLAGELATLATAIKQLPAKPAAYVERAAEATSGSQKVALVLAETEQELFAQAAQLAAAELMLARSRPLAEGEAARAKAAQEIAALRAQLATQRIALEAAREELRRVELAAGVGDEGYRAEEAQRKRLVALVEQERGAGRVDAKGAGLLGRLSAVEAAADAAEHDLDTRVAQRRAELEKVVAEERGRLLEYRKQLASVADASEDVIAPVARAGFLAAKERFYSLVMRADLGAVDVAWAAREEHRERVESLTRDRVSTLSALDEEFREIMEQPGSKGITP